MIEHKDLLSLFFDEDECFEQNNFDFIGSDGNIYVFDVENFKYLCQEYKREHVTDCISIVNGSLNQMIRNEIAVAKK